MICFDADFTDMARHHGNQGAQVSPKMTSCILFMNSKLYCLIGSSWLNYIRPQN